MRRTARRLPRLSAVVAVAVALLVPACGSTGGQSATPTPALGAPTSSAKASVDPSSTTTPESAQASAPAADPTASSDWPTYDRTAGRSAVSVSTPAFTAASRLVKSWVGRVDGDVYAQPLVIGAEVVVATENNSVYALSSSTGRQVWMRHLGPAVTTGLACDGNINPGGITGTPVADPTTDRLYVVSFSPYRHTLWSLNLTTGATMWDRDVDGPGSDPRAEQARSALTLVNGRVYIPYGGLFGDCGDYHGWVVGAPASGKGKLVTYVTPTQREAGIWGPPGAAAGHGSLYVATGNGTPTDAIDDSDSVIRLSPSTLEVQGTFTPPDWQSLSADDLDLGSTSPALLPDNFLLQIGKDGTAYVVDATSLGGVGGERGASHVCSGGFGGDAVDARTVVISCFNSLTAVSVTPSTRTSAAQIKVLWSAGAGAGPPIIAGGVVWDVSRSNQLTAYRLDDGKEVASTDTATVVTSFPTLAASEGQLFVPEGREIVAYRGA